MVNTFNQFVTENYTHGEVQEREILINLRDLIIDFNTQLEIELEEIQNDIQISHDEMAKHSLFRLRSDVKWLVTRAAELNNNIMLLKQDEDSNDDAKSLNNS